MDRIELTNVKHIKINNESRWQAKAKFPGYPRGKSIAIFSIGDHLVAIPSLCPHEGADFIEGKFIDKETIECPAHQNRYNIFTDLQSYMVETTDDDKMFIILGAPPLQEFKKEEVIVQTTNSSNDESVPKQTEETFLSSTEYEKKIRAMTIELEELKSVKAAQEVQVIEGYNQIERMLTEMEEKNVTLEKQKDTIEKANDFINLVTNTMEEILLVIGTDGKVKQANKKMTLLLGYSTVEILHKNPDVFVSKEDLTELRKRHDPNNKKPESILFFITSNNQQIDMVINLIKKNGDPLVHLVRGSQLFNSKGKKDGVVLVCTNIQELQRVQNELMVTLEKVDKLREESERLLLNVLPQSVADELKTVGTVKPVTYERASVLFTDFKGFTNYAEKVTPEFLINELDLCFSSFDNILQKYSIEKLKTIGDAYMCAGGIPEKNKRNPFEVVLAALEMANFIETIKKIKMARGEPFFELRIGIHTGPLVAGVVGVKKFAYDIWGDTVNIASRMESSGEPGKVNISKDTHQIVKDFFDCTSRGMVYAKRKGDMEMFFVNRILPKYSEDSDGIIPNDELINYIHSLDN
jgi:PAS domain S-box-containing protein